MPGYNQYSLASAQQEPNNSDIYIASAAMVSPQASFEALVNTPAVYSGDQLTCIEPDYTKYVDAKLIRRMSRIIKMGVAAASEALSQANLSQPDAIITGTAYGCLADTDQFLSRLVEFKETLLSPTAFIQSTHNTVAAQIALMLKCHNYNNTYVHRGSSFEAALTDAISMLEEGDAKNILVGAADEITDKSHAILKRFGLYKNNGNSAALINNHTKGTMAGDGAAFFVISNTADAAIAKLDAFKNYYKPQESANTLIAGFLKENDLEAKDIDLVITGANGDSREANHYENITLFDKKNVTTYKQFCGEYPTSSAFALWMAANILKRNHFNGNKIKRMLIYNNYLLQYPSLYLLSAC